MTGEVDRSALTDFALRLVARASPSGQEGEVAELVGDEMRHLGYQVEVDALGNVTGMLERGEGPCLLSFCTNGSGTAGRLGIPTIGFGPGEQEMAHRVDEYVELEQLAAAARGYGAIAERALRSAG